MSHDLILLVVGFVLTTVLGGALGSFFQRRAWNQQHHLQKREEEKTQALKTFEEISRLFDKRIYRMRLMSAALVGLRRNRDDESTESLDDARREYKAVLIEWNDNLNRVLALIEVSFGRAMREAVEELYAQYAALGRALDLALRLELREDADPVALKSIDFSRRLKRLSDGVYQTNVRMLALLRDDEQRVAGPEPGVQGQVQRSLHARTSRWGTKGQLSSASRRHCANGDTPSTSTDPSASTRIAPCGDSRRIRI
jgi:hypothetical protein